MATQFFEYQDSAGTSYGVPMTDAQQNVYGYMVGTLPTGYSTLSALQTAVPGALALPSGLNLRRITVTSDFFGSAQLPVLTSAEFAAIEPTGAAPFPLAAVSVTEDVSITGASGEVRNSN